MLAALDVATGLVKAGNYKRRKRRQFLSFMFELVAEYTDQELHIILINPKTHKPKIDRRCPGIPMSTSTTPYPHIQLKQIDFWFSILSRSALRVASFNSVRNVGSAIDHFIDAYNENAHTFEWKATKVKTESTRR